MSGQPPPQGKQGSVFSSVFNILSKEIGAFVATATGGVAPDVGIPDFSRNFNPAHLAT
jgi:hypothetical protein